ncbi:c-type cytochrome [Stieleria sp. TO1_6]|uniref:c-type cytochrome n=1 Tax=Stieleria tagensis TaxID=2956795 RepID=UPI00209ABD08|nr:c-type cytochrome [Stieleria tagensis]MCO8125206.1 c-type cytochrome [Stieleria tagensis]
MRFLRTPLLALVTASCLIATLATAQDNKTTTDDADPALRGNIATPVDRITTAKDFQVELIYSVPGDQQGSWVNLCVDNKQRLIVSDQFGGLYRITPPPAGQSLQADDVQPVPADIRAVNGMVWAMDALYVAVNDYENKIPSGFYRLTDSDGDDQLDKVELLRELQTRGDHGVHAVVPTADGKSFYLVCGNNTKPTETAASSAVPEIWGEDHLLPRLPDGRGFMRDALGPGGTIYRVSPDGKTFEMVATGFRNIFDASLNLDGELFTYDADMEYDFNTSWYRPTRINHVLSGADFGWRNGAGKRPGFYPDTWPATLNIGPGSPTGTTFGYGAKFPAKYQRAFFAMDWSWGKMYAVHLQPEGASYTATKEEFLTGAPLPVTDAIIHPADGAMYFTIGGRRVQSGLYRVTYTGDESVEPVSDTGDSIKDNAAFAKRHALEAFHGLPNPDAIPFAWESLDDPDRVIRLAARTAIEHQPIDQWTDKALGETNPGRQVEALLGLARAAGVCPQHRGEGDPAVDQDLRAKLLAALLAIDWDQLDHSQQLTFVRTIEIALNRFGVSDDDTARELVEKLDPHFPAASADLNWLLCETLVFLQAPSAAEKTLALLDQATSQEEQIEYARSLRMLRAGWTIPMRERYLQWLLKAANYRGGASFEKFISFIRRDALATLTDQEKSELAELLAKEPQRKSVLENLGQVFAGRTLNDWTLDTLSAAATSKLLGRDFQQGRKMFAATGCYACHRFDNQGGMTGPDLSSAGRRYSPHDFLDQIINPSKVINEQFSAVRVLTDEGRIHTGVVVNLKGDTVTLNTDLTDPNQRVSIDRNTIEVFETSKTSAMPEKLLAPLTEDEVLDLVAYVLSGADRNHRFFEKPVPPKSE